MTKKEAISLRKTGEEHYSFEDCVKDAVNGSAREQQGRHADTEAAEQDN